MLLLDCVKLEFGACALLCLFLSFLGLLLILSLNRTFEAWRKGNRFGPPEGLYQESRTAGLASLATLLLLLVSVDPVGWHPLVLDRIHEECGR